MGKMEIPERRTSFLPSVRCSTCGVEVELDILAKHVCEQLLKCEFTQFPSNTLLPADVRGASESSNHPPALLPTVPESPSLPEAKIARPPKPRRPILPRIIP